jgi:hypothetical protein
MPHSTLGLGLAAFCVAAAVLTCAASAERAVGHETTAERDPYRCRTPGASIENIALDDRKIQEAMMKIITSLFLAASLLSGCISSSNPSPPAKTTVVVPQNSGTTVVCQNGSSPPC